MIEHNLRLVAHIVKKYYANQNDQEDLISIGTIGLIKAVDTFDAEKGIKLSSYASRCIEKNDPLIADFLRSEQEKDTPFLPEKPKWHFACQIDSDTYMLSKREKGLLSHRKNRRIVNLLEAPTEALLDEYTLFLCKQGRVRMTRKMRGKLPSNNRGEDEVSGKGIGLISE